MASTFGSAKLVRPFHPGAPGIISSPADTHLDTPITPQLQAERNQLLAAAMVVLRRSGDFKVEAVLREAGLSTRSFYRHFEKKNDLLVMLMDFDITNIAIRLQRATTTPDTITEQIRAWVATVIGSPYRQDIAKQASTYSEQLRIFRTEYPEMIDRWNEITRAPLDIVMTQSCARGELRSDDPVEDAKVICQLVTNMTADFAVMHIRPPREEIERAVMRLISPAIELR